MQTTNSIFMVRPIKFDYNQQTAVNNEFQSKSNDMQTQQLALKEFDNFVDTLQNNNVNVVVCDDTPLPHTPDSIFPNNWFSTHENGQMVIYSMFAPNRRDERKDEFLDVIEENLSLKQIIDFSTFEQQNLFLEGTGSMVLDRENKIVYACRSIRTSERLVDLFCQTLGYTSVIFDGIGCNGMPIYHTNVLMSVGIDFAVVCLECIKDEKQKEALLKSLKNTNKEIIEISYKQLENFAGNMLEIRNKHNERLLVMSQSAKNCLTKKQFDILTSKCKIIAVDIKTIEQNGGGSARCMMAELFK